MVGVKRRGKLKSAGVVAGLALAAGAAAMIGGAPTAVAQDAKPPYWASIKSNPAIMRRGPSSELPAYWTYVRRGLPIKILAVREDWRQVQDPGGTVGWMHRRLLSGKRTAIVIGETQPMHSSPSADAPVAFRAEPGVVGAISDCSADFCLFDVTGRSGWIATDGIWGDGPA